MARRSLELRRALGARQGVARCLDILGEVAVARGNLERAARIYGAVDSMWQAIGFARALDEVDRYERELESIRQALGERAFSSAWEVGRALDTDDAVREGMGELPGASEEPAYSADDAGQPFARAGASDSRGSPAAFEPVPAPGGPSAVDIVTRRERDVAILLARGLTNRQIAQTLVVTEGTAANAIRRVLQRLGFQNRAQVAAWAVEHGLHELPIG